MSDVRNLGETALRAVRGQPSAEIMRVGCAKPIAFVRLRGQPSAEIVRVGCRETYAKLRYALYVVNPLRRSCVSNV